MSASGNAVLQNGTTSFTVRVDLSKLAPGMYEMFVRKSDGIGAITRLRSVRIELQNPRDALELPPSLRLK